MIPSYLLCHNLMSHKAYNNYKDKLIQSINSMYLSSYNLSLLKLQDDISLSQQCQFLKRFYAQYQYPNKIIMLSQYYQYHKQLPRIFQNNIFDIVDNYYQDIRNAEYKYVTRKMKQPQTQRVNNKPVFKNSDKLIKNIQLSYYNFQDKNSKKNQKNNKQNKENKIVNKNKKSMPELMTTNQIINFQYNKYQDNKKMGYKSVLPPQHPNRSKQSQHNNKSKQYNKISIKTKSKEAVVQKCSLNNSNSSTKNLSRSKSKSNFNIINPSQTLKRLQTKPLQEKNMNVNKNDKIKSSGNSLQKTVSSKNFLRSIDQKKSMKNLIQSVDKKINNNMNMNSNNGIKDMFKKVMQTKKMIKLIK